VPESVSALNQADIVNVLEDPSKLFWSPKVIKSSVPSNTKPPPNLELFVGVALFAPVMVPLLLNVSDPASVLMREAEPSVTKPSQVLLPEILLIAPVAD